MRVAPALIVLGFGATSAAVPLLSGRRATVPTAPLLGKRRPTVPTAPLLGERRSTGLATALLGLRGSAGGAALRCAAVRTLCRCLARSGRHALLGALRAEEAGRGRRRHLGTATSALRVDRAGREDQHQCDARNYNYACVTSHRSYSL